LLLLYQLVRLEIRITGNHPLHVGYHLLVGSLENLIRRHEFHLLVQVARLPQCLGLRVLLAGKLIASVAFQEGSQSVKAVHRDATHAAGSILLNGASLCHDEIPASNCAYSTETDEKLCLDYSSNRQTNR